MQSVLVVLQIILAVFLIGLVLIQRTDDSSMGGLGGGMGGNSLISRRSAGNLLTRMTTLIALFFALTSLGLTILAQREVKSPSLLEKIPTEKAAPLNTPVQSGESQKPAQSE
ncbi:MAG: preprotein translocase subunit SecG [Alphaproteobacteria bacterium]|nr:preprotein translocase subunit SecG [Alphaproteobacteria bacterium]NCB49554.1 preprotein translocase subunit SecG [Alphaproteobacteria bacterium]